jgi:ferredoxin-NADP reductase
MTSSLHAPDFAAPASQPWSSDRDEQLRCVHIRQETHDVKTFVLAADGPRSFRYVPGQFITLELHIGGQTVNRCYTLSSSPTRPDTVSITVKRVPGGQVSNWLHDNLRVGMALGVMGPSGVFSCFPTPAAKYLFVSGGSGITPLMSMARTLHDVASHADVVFVHCARTPADILFAEELTLMARNMPQLRLAMVCEQLPHGSAYAGHVGRLDAARLAHIAPDFLQRDVYTCGPAPFMGAVRSLLGGAGYPMAQYREESFSFEELSPVATEAATPVAAANDTVSSVPSFKIELQKSGQSFSCRADQTILQAATAALVRLPSSCSSGACGTCKTRKLSGQVEMKHAGGIRQREIDQGWMLPCCSKPQSDIALER